MTEIRESAHKADEMETVVEAGRILMESGAEIYRIRDTMSHMAAALQIDHFSAYVINRGIFASGISPEGVQKSKIVSTPESSVHLGRIEAVNSLSRELDEKKGSISVEDLASWLREIQKETADPLWKTLLAYFLSTGCFSFAIGNVWQDALVSALSALIMGLAAWLIGKHIRSNVLLTIIQCVVVTVSANILFLLGLGIHRGLIILGGFIVLVPGALYTNSIREFSENNYSTGITLLMSSTLTCFSMAVGAILGTELLPFADQMTDFFPDIISTPPEMLLRTIAAGIGTAAFSYFYHSPGRYYKEQGMTGATSWLLCMIINMLFHKSALAVFISAFTAALNSRLLAARCKCPRTIFLSGSIFPLLPGLSFFWGVYMLMTGSTLNGAASMRSCFLSAFAISLAISSVQQIPDSFFSRMEK